MSRSLFVTAGMILCVAVSQAQSTGEKDKIERACLDYLEGFYEGDTLKLSRALSPAMYKIGNFRNKEGNYVPDGQMTYRDAINYASRVLAKKSFPKPGAIKKVEVLDTGHSIASAKVYAWWGMDYVLLSKQNEQWLITHVLWEGPI